MHAHGKYSAWPGSSETCVLGSQNIHALQCHGFIHGSNTSVPCSATRCNAVQCHAMSCMQPIAHQTMCCGHMTKLAGFFGSTIVASHEALVIVNMTRSALTATADCTKVILPPDVSCRGVADICLHCLKLL